MNIIDTESRKLAQQLQLAVLNGRIISPGKFENEPLSTLYFYDAYLNGEGEYLDDQTQKFELTTTDQKELNTYHKYYYLLFSENGFITSSYGK